MRKNSELTTQLALVCSLEAEQWGLLDKHQLSTGLVQNAVFLSCSSLIRYSRRPARTLKFNEMHHEEPQR